MNTKLVLELGMPHLGRSNLSETALLKAIGHHRWGQIQSEGAVRSALIRDDAGARLYATFYFFELNFSLERPLSAFGENDVIEFQADLAHYGRVYMDGRHVLSGDPSCWIRSSNVFIYQERGPSKLSISPPANMDFENIPELCAPPESLDLCRQAKLKGVFFNPENGDVPLFADSREVVCPIDQDRDLNGAGLLYFANYICFLDAAERRILSALTDPVPESLLDDRSTYRRRIGYYGNAGPVDQVRISLRATARVLSPHPDQHLLDFGFDYRMSRLCDGKEIAVSSCRKVAPVPRGSEGEHWISRHPDLSTSSAHIQPTLA